MEKIRILILAIDPDLPTSWYRIVRPLSVLKNVEYKIIRKNDSIGWSDLENIDLALVMRPAGGEQVMLLRSIKDRGIPIWADYDDDMFSVPYHHEDWAVWASDFRRKTTIECMELADIVTVTTHTLRDALKARCKQPPEFVVIPNAIDDYAFPEPTKPFELQPKIAFWRGMNSHAMDLLSAKPLFERLSQELPLVFFGMKPWIVAPEMKRENWTWIPAISDPIHVFNRMKKINACVQVVPLVDDPLNRSKSNIAFLEGAWLGGSVVMGPQFWEPVCGALWRDDDWEWTASKVLEIINHPEERVQAVQKSQELIAEKYLLSKVNKMRSCLIEEYAK